MKNALKKEKRVVKRLIMQYNEYSEILELIKTKANDKLKNISEISKKKKLTLSEIMRSEDSFEELKKVNSEINILKTDLAQVSDEMTFKSPTVWMLYKYTAYKGANNEISNLGQFRTHCSPKGYICTQRFIFLKKYLNDNYQLDIDDKELFPDEINLVDFIQHPILQKLSEDIEFMKQWKANEYFKSDGRINKWHLVKD